MPWKSRVPWHKILEASAIGRGLPLARGIVAHAEVVSASQLGDWRGRLGRQGWVDVQYRRSSRSTWCPSARQRLSMARLGYIHGHDDSSLASVQTHRQVLEGRSGGVRWLGRVRRRHVARAAVRHGLVADGDSSWR
ncbi:hypothetical protein M6B38_375615 [Iris pallida]|uniref:Uncharacterized protein n=1 Tax=Iris pallida TaxID=29817 RepID=A0AAX6GCC3_IRIPA|nr:hypothetical protein M6B38_375615 [Iris pallida]